MLSFRRLLYSCETLVLALLTLVSCSTNTQCLQGVCAGKQTENEKQVLSKNPFIPEAQMTDIWSEVSKTDVYFANTRISEFDSAIPANSFTGIQEDMLVPSKHCPKEKYIEELTLALNEAAEAKAQHAIDSNIPLKIPVQYSISFGTPMDATAHAAFKRSILKADDDGITPVFVAPAADWRYSGNAAKHYLANHSRARAEYIRGERCFFSTIEVLPNELKTGAVSADHGENIMYYGDHYGVTYGEEPATERKRRAAFAPRLFTQIENITFSPVTNSVQHYESVDYIAAANANTKNVIPLYVADIRDGRLAPFSVVRPEFASSATRRLEYFASLRSMLDLPKMHENFSCIGSQLGEDYEVNGFNFGAYDRTAIAQLLRNLIYSGSAQGIVTPRQYTPLILDLGDSHIRTSSMQNGTYFNLANVVELVEPCQCENPGTYHLERMSTLGVPHRTAWLGGELKIASCGVEDCSQQPFWEVQANDGFLVTLDSNGKVASGLNLFGDHRRTSMGGFHKNGFEALAELAQIDCASKDATKRLVGPWMDSLYFDTLRVWVDKNRDGISQATEIASLAESKVAAINPCHIFMEKDGLRDRFGNETNMRSAFLYWPSMEIRRNDPEQQKEILQQFETGVASTGKRAIFRVMADVIFLNDETDFLRNVDASRLRRLKDIFTLFEQEN
jgi:hypothetical protein